MTHDYEEADVEIVASWRTVHQNDQETYVAIHHFRGSSVYFVDAYDLDEDGEGMQGEHVAETVTEAEARERATRWMDEHPKGVLGGDGESGGVGDTIANWLRQRSS